MSDCPECYDEEFGIIEDQKTMICLDCGYCRGDRQGGSLTHHEGRVRRTKILLDELYQDNTNIRKDEQIDRDGRIINLIQLEMDYYHRWIGSEADKEYMRRKRKSNRPRGLGNYRL